MPLALTCSCGGIIDPTDEEPGAHFVEEIVGARVEAVRYGRYRHCRACHAPVLAPLPDGLGSSPKLGVADPTR